MSTKPLKEYLGAIDVAITGIAIGHATNSANGGNRLPHRPPQLRRAELVMRG